MSLKNITLKALGNLEKLINKKHKLASLIAAIDKELDSFTTGKPSKKRGRPKTKGKKRGPKAKGAKSKKAGNKVGKSKVANKKAKSKIKKTAGKGKRQPIAPKVIAALKGATKGMNLAEIAKATNLKKSSLGVWIYTTGRKFVNKVSKGRFSLKS